MDCLRAAFWENILVNLIVNGDFSGAVSANPDLDPAGWLVTSSGNPTTEQNQNDVQVIGGQLNFNAAPGTSLGSQIAQTVTGVPIGESINLSFAYSEAAGAASSDRNITYTVRDGNGNVVLTGVATTPGAYSLNFTATTNNYTITFHDNSTGNNQPNAIIDNVSFNVPFVVCFARGTLICTDKGEVAVENLALGDLVLTRDDGLQPIRWRSSQTVDARTSLAPILIKAGALGNDHDLRVSPQHRMLISDWRAELLFGESEVLVAAKNLVNDTNILRAPADSVEYFHFMFDKHQLVCANGTWSESFFPGNFALRAIENGPRDELFGVFPELRQGADNYGPAARTSPKPVEARLLGA